MIDIAPILGKTIKLRNGDIACSKCGSLVVKISNGKAMHAASLWCADCGHFYKWMAIEAVAVMLDTIGRYGWPDITIQTIQHELFASAASPGANAVVSSRPQGTETMTGNDFDDLYGSKYLSAADLKGEEPRYRISHVEGPKDMKQNDGTTKKRLILHFSGVDKALVLNQTNALRLKDLFGNRDACTGHEVELYSEPTSLGKDGVRLRQVRPAAKKAPEKPDPISSGRPTDPDLDDAIPF